MRDTRFQLPVTRGTVIKYQDKSFMTRARFR